jgi:hypothetical protein
LNDALGGFKAFSRISHQGHANAPGPGVVAVRIPG